jgi:hypothetical protein
MNTLKEHSYEELRSVIVDILLKRETVKYPADQYRNLTTGIAEVFNRRENPGRPFNPLFPEPRLHPNDVELTRDVFWDLFRQGVIILGVNDSNEGWPFFRLSHFGQKMLKEQNFFRFHDTSSYILLVRTQAPGISDEAVSYLDEAIATFYADCLLACCVMIGGAAEAEFLRLIDVAKSSKTYGSFFANIPDQDFIRKKITKFREALDKIAKKLPHEAVEDYETNFLAIQSILRIARNEAGHPTTAKLDRNNVYVYLNLFIPFARQLMRLKDALK